MSDKNLNIILSEFTDAIIKIFNDKLKAIILFGSFARNDYDNESDIDIMVLVDIDKIKIKDFRNEIVKLTARINMKYDVVLSPIIQNFLEYEIYKDSSGFFKNIQNEGVIINARKI